MSRKIPSPPRTVLIELYCNQQMTSREIGDYLGVHSSVVYRWLKLHDIERRQSARRLSPATPDEARRAREYAPFHGYIYRNGKGVFRDGEKVAEDWRWFWFKFHPQISAWEQRVGDLYWVVNDMQEGTFYAEPIPKSIQSELKPIEGGYGYYGVLLYDPEIDRVQCHECGVWRRAVGSHIRVHGYDGRGGRDDYKDKYGLGRLGLCIPSLSAYWREHAFKVGLPEYDNEGPWPPENPSGPSEYARLRMTATHRTEEQRLAVSERQKERFRNPRQLERQSALLDRIRLSPEQYAEARRRKGTWSDGIPESVRENLSRSKFALSEPNRTAILQYIRDHPGCHPLDVTRDLGFNEGRRAYYVRQLKERGLVNTVGGGASVRYYPVYSADKNADNNPKGSD